MLTTMNIVTDPNMTLDKSNSDQRKMERYNSIEGSLTGYDCKLCLNKGYVMVLTEGYTGLETCSCNRIRKNMAIVEKSGLKKMIDSCSFEKYLTPEPWQKSIKDTAIKYLQNLEGNWFFIGGQVGAGKSHICTAIVSELMKQGKETVYMLWRDDSVALKKLLVDDGEYCDEIARYKKAKVLYIDDLFKMEKGKPPTAADINLAFEIINYRYINQDLITVISSEKNISEIIAIDEAIGSRIYHRASCYCIQIGNDKLKNIRLRISQRNEANGRSK